MTSLPRQINLLAAILAIALASSGSPSLLAAPRALLKQDNIHLRAARDGARVVERLSPAKPLHMTLALPLRNEADLEQLLQDLYDPASPRYGSYLTSEEFTARFGPTPDDYRKLIDFAEARGMTVTQKSSNRTVLSVDAPAQTAEQVFGVVETVYERADGTRFHAPDREPSLVDCPVEVLCVGGLDNAYPLRHAPIIPVASHPAAPAPRTNGVVTDAATGNNGFSPADLRKAYDVPATATGAGVTLGIFQNMGYLASDIAAYQSYYGTSVPLENVYFDTRTAANQGQSGEATLDIEMQIAMAPGAAKVITYIGDSGLSIVNHIATDNRAQCVSISFGFDDGTNQAMNQTLKQMAAQGQSVFCASGDSGAWSPPGQGRPSDMPYMTAVGGTSLHTNTDGSWLAEPAWSGSGGGVSTLWSIPSYQRGVSMAVNGGSTAMRNGPDVAMVADPYTGVSFYNNGAWGGVGGTSASAPLWAGVAALIDQQRAANGLGPIGFLNPAVYAVGTGPYAAADFHDIAAGNNANSYTTYSAVPGYDLVTGWGTPVVANLLTDLADGSSTPDYRLTSSPLTVSQGTSGTSTLSVALLNGSAANVSLGVGAPPPGLTASLGAASTSTTSVLTVTANSTAAPGTYAVKVTGTAGSTVHVTYVPVTVEATTGAVTAVDLTAARNVYAIYTDGTAFTTAGFDGNYAFSSNLLGPSVGWSGVTFPFGPANAPSAVTGATVALPAGSYGKIDLVASSANGFKAARIFKVTYTDNTTVSFTQDMSDWVIPSYPTGESFVTGPLAYRDTNGGGQDPESRPYLYGYSFALDPARTVKSITLPADGNVVIFAMALVQAPASVNYNLSAAPGSLTLPRGGSVATTVSVGSTTGFNGSVGLTAAGLPAGVTAAFSAASTTGASVLTLTASSAATIGSANVIVTGVSGSLTQSVTVPLAVRAAFAPVSFAAYTNLQGIYTDGTAYTSNGLDGSYNAYSATLMGSAVTWNGIPFAIGAANTYNVVQANGQKITLPTGVFSSLGMLACATGGSQAAQNFRLNYTDGTSTVVTQSLSDWYGSQGYAGESIAISLAYRAFKDGTSQYFQGFLYGYTLPIDHTRTVSSIVLPNNNNVKILAFTLVPVGTDGGVTPLSVAETWRLRYFNNTSNTGSGADGADPDGDGISNLLERALGQDPTVAKVSGLPKLTVDTATNRLVLTATRGGANATDLVFAAEASVDLVTWTTDNLTVLVNTATSYQVRDDAPTVPRRFLRLRVTQP